MPSGSGPRSAASAANVRSVFLSAVAGLGSYEVCLGRPARIGSKRTSPPRKPLHTSRQQPAAPPAAPPFPARCPSNPVALVPANKYSPRPQVAAGVYAQGSNPFGQMSERPPCLLACRPPPPIRQRARTNSCAGLHTRCTPRYATRANRRPLFLKSTICRERVSRGHGGVLTENWRDRRRAGVPPRGGHHGDRAPRLQDL